MAKNFVQEGDVLDLTAPAGGVVTGTLYKIGRIVGVAMRSADVSATFPLKTTGVFDLVKVNLEPWSEGLLIYYNSGSGLCTSTSTTAILIGCAVRTEASGTSFGRVRLNGAAEFTNQ